MDAAGRGTRGGQHARSLSHLPRQGAAAFVTLYQRYLSPRKGFSCPHRLLHGGESCSGYVKRRVLEEGPVAAVRPARLRFAACREARYLLSATLFEETGRRHHGPQRSERRPWWRRWPRRWRDADCDCDVCDFLDCSP